LAVCTGNDSDTVVGELLLESRAAKFHTNAPDDRVIDFPRSPFLTGRFGARWTTQ
jgi:hypothetical protein